MSRHSISVSEADAMLQGMIRRFGRESVPIWDAVGRILAEPVVADAEYPPFDRVCMDGFAMRHDSIVAGTPCILVEGFAPAGCMPIALQDPAACIEVMTGAPLPPGCDTIVPVEDVQREGDTIVLRTGAELRPGRHIHPRGRDYGSGHTLVSAGAVLTGPRLAAAAAAGVSRLIVAQRPRVHLVVTGDELVPVEERPLGALVRMTHPYALQGLLAAWATLSWEHARDDVDVLCAAIGNGFKDADALLLTGGVSAGKLDMVPAALEAMGAMRRFHKVDQKPGRPLWVGEMPDGPTVFAFPGNPVSALICARRYFVPWLWRGLGKTVESPVRLPLAEPMRRHEDKVLFAPVRRRNAESGGWELSGRSIHGSGDFAGLADTDGFVELPSGRGEIEAGELVSFYDWDAS